MLKFLQINVNRSHAAHDLLKQEVRENKIDVIIGQEPNKSRAAIAYCDIDIDSFIICVNRNLTVINCSRDNGFVCVELSDVFIYSCYFSPNRRAEEFEQYLYKLGRHINRNKEKKKQVIIGGDLNSKAVIFGSPVENEKGRVLEEWIESNDLAVLNKGNTPTFSNANGSSLIDVTVSTDEISKQIENWHVDVEAENMSPHHNIRFDLIRNSDKRRTSPRTQNGWKLTAEGLNKIKEANAETFVVSDNDQITPQVLTTAITKMCQEFLPRKRTTPRHGLTPVYWWTSEIADLRRRCIRSRRAVARINRTSATPERKAETTEAYKEAKRDLKTAINKQKKVEWEKLCDDLDNDIWGKGYQIVMKKLRLSPPKVLNDEKIKLWVEKLFPKHPINVWMDIVVAEEEIPMFQRTEIIAAAKKIKTKKAPGPDNIPPEVMKAVAEKNPDLVTEVFNHCLKSGEFPGIWKVARLVLIEKPKKDPNSSETYRPICLLDSEAKLLEQLIKGRLVQELDDKGAIHDHQYGFRAGRSTTDALDKVIDIVRKNKQKAYKNRECYCMITLDIENAFNSAPWQKIIAALKRAGISGYLVRMIQSYLTNRYIVTPNDQKIKVTSGVPQGSVVGPTLWNVFYDEILRVKIDKAATLVAYADDLAIIVGAKSKSQLEDLAQLATNMVVAKLEEMGIKLATKKTEMVLLYGDKKINNLEIVVAGSIIRKTKELKYMGMHIDQGVRMTTHVKEVCAKANKKITTLSRIMPNMGGPRYRKRRVLVSAVMSIVLYGAIFWKDALRYKHYEKMLEQLNRKLAIRIIAAYRTVPTEAALALAGMPPIKLKVEERVTFQTKQMNRKEARAHMLQEWQNRWARYDGWAKVFIKDVKQWMERKWGEVDYHMSQTFTGHGVFGKYLQRIGKQEHDRCWYCDQEDTAEHTLFVCSHWTQQRGDLRNLCGIDVTKENVARLLLESEENWNAITAIFSKIMKEKEAEEFRREAERERRQR